jgi:hypothetical protein
MHGTAQDALWPQMIVTRSVAFTAKTPEWLAKESVSEGRARRKPKVGKGEEGKKSQRLQASHEPVKPVIGCIQRRSPSLYLVSPSDLRPRPHIAPLLPSAHAVPPYYPMTQVNHPFPSILCTEFHHSTVLPASLHSPSYVHIEAQHSPSTSPAAKPRESASTCASHAHVSQQHFSAPVAPS